MSYDGTIKKCLNLTDIYEILNNIAKNMCDMSNLSRTFVH